MANNFIPYANAIYGIGKELNKEKIFFNYSNELLELIQNEKKVINFFSSYYVSFLEKKELLDEVFPKTDEMYKNWLLILIMDRKFFYIKEILLEFINIYNKNNNIENGVVWTTLAITDLIKNKIVKTLEKKLNKKINLTSKINKELISGIKIELSDLIIDNSLKNNLNEMKKQLLFNLERGK